MTTTPAARQRTQAVLTVQTVEELAPHLVRVTLGGPGIADLRHNEHTDKYVKILFAEPELGLEPPYDLDAIREEHGPAHLPVRRTYTVRAWDTDAGSITLDFVTHGDEGVAGPWARAARPGDRLAMSGAGGAYSPNLDAEWFLLIGDDTALPAISAAVEALPVHARGHVVVEVDDAQDEVLPAVPPGVSVVWLHRHGEAPGRTSLLPGAVRDLDWPEDPAVVDVFAHGEREAMKQLRDVVLKEHAIPRVQVSLSGYWAYGRTEDAFQAEKREPIGQVLPPA